MGKNFFLACVLSQTFYIVYFYSVTKEKKRNIQNAETLQNGMIFLFKSHVKMLWYNQIRAVFSAEMLSDVAIIFLYLCSMLELKRK
jgi:hypothetical protein